MKFKTKTKKKKRKEELIRTTRETLENQKVKTALTWVFEILVTLGLASVVAIFFFQTITMQEAAMEPSVAVGDKFFMNRMIYKIGSPKRGDIIAFKTSSSEDAVLHVRRVIGLPGESIRIEDGNILINGEIYAEDQDFPAMLSAGLAADSIKLGSNEYFVLGDNRNNSEDSRYADIGVVQKKYIAGKLWFQISPFESFGFLKK